MTEREDAAEGHGEAAPVTDRGFRQLLDTLSASYNFDFREYKERSLARRILARMAQVRVDGFEAYAQYLEQHPAEHVHLFNTILINVTGFFRDSEAWRVLGEDVLPRLVSEAAESKVIRVWSAGCSSGEETFSLAILLAEQLGNRGADYVVKIYGTDVDEEALAAARHALYRLDQLRDVPGPLIDRYFSREGQLYRFRRDLRRWCVFGAHNLTQTPPLSNMDLVVCRNVLIYFTSELQERVLSRFHYALRRGGYLFLGRSESLLARSRLFTAHHAKWRIFQRAPSDVPAPAPDRHPGHEAARGDAERGETAPSPTVQRALDALPSAVMVIDMTDTLLVWNAAAEGLFDIPAGNALGRKFRDLDVSYRVEGLRARIEEVKGRHRTIQIDAATFTRRHGEVVHADITVAPLFEAQRIVGVAVVSTDATERARLKEQATRIAEQHATAIEELQSTNEELETTNEELQSTNEELETTVEELQVANAELGTLNTELNRLDLEHRSLLNSVEDAVLVLDRDGVVITWNPAAERMLGLRAGQVIGRELSALPLGKEAPRLRAAFERITGSDQSEDLGDMPYTLPGGEGRRGVVRFVPIRNDAGEVTGAVAMITPEPHGRSD